MRATDSAEQTTEAPFDLEIIDDTEAPTLQLNKPAGDFSLEPGASFELQGSAGDNQWVDAIDAVFIDPQSKEEHAVAWTLFSRMDRVETVKVPNPGTLGAVLVGQRFYADFEARLRLTPELTRRYSGKVLQLVLRARDRGVNEIRSPSINVTVLADDKGPQINIQQPLERLFDRQKTQLQVNLKDDTAVASYEVRLLDDDGRNEVLAQATGLSEAEINVPSSGVKEIDIERYRPQTEPIALTLTVKALSLIHI